MTPATADRLVLAQGTIHDPATGRDGVIDDIWIERGTIVPRPADARGFHRIDCTGLVVMPGGVDLHSHVAGPKVGFGRRIAPQLARREGAPAAVPTIHATGAAYAALGYTTVFDAAIATSAAAMATSNSPICRSSTRGSICSRPTTPRCSPRSPVATPARPSGSWPLQ